MPAVNVHTHTDRSLMDSVAKPSDIVLRVKELGQNAVAITDHGTTSALIDTYNACKKQGIKMIFGCEHYYCPSVNIKERGYRHINFWAANQIGYHNLLKLTTEAHQNFYYKPRIDLSLIKKYNEGLLMSSACLGGWLRNSDSTPNLYLLEQFLEIFGDRLYIELHTYSAEEQQSWNMKIVNIAREYNIPLVAACDSHYVRKDDSAVHKAWLTQGKEREDGYYNTPEFYLHSEREMLEALAYTGCAEEAVANTQALADRCNVEIKFGEQHYPTVDIENEEEAIRAIIRNNWKEKIPDRGKWGEYADRIKKEEFPVLAKANYFQYFLVTHDFIKYCLDKKIPLGYSRGSVGGCLTAFAMGLIQTDALKHNLNFARFCHLERVTPADIDIDISQRKRGEAIEYLKQKYGDDRIFKVRTYGYMKARGALKRAGNALGYEPKDVNGWSKSIPDFDNDEEYKGDEHESHLISQTDAPNDLKQLAKNFVGILQNFGSHASAILIFPDEPDNYTAIERGKECPVCAYDFHTLEAMGCLKLDVLGVKTVDVIADTIHMSGEQIDTTNLPLDDKTTFDMLCAGRTAGVFQIEGVGFTQLIKQIQPRHFDDLAPLLAVYRPGIIGAGLLDTYIKRKQGKETVEYLLPELKPILQNTVGIIVFQEQIIEIAKTICGYTDGQADMLRRAVGRKKIEEMEQIKPDFITRAVGQGQTKDNAEKLFKLIEYFASYGFNKCLSGRERICRNVNSGDAPFMPTIAEMYKIKNNYEYAKETNRFPLHEKYKRYGYGYALSMVNGRAVKNKIVDITFSGIMPVYLVTTDTGRELRCTLNHKLPTPDGIKMLSEISIGEQLFTIGAYEPKVKQYEKEIPIVTEKIVSIKYECTEDCYDVEMEAPAHNFIINSGIVVCNSHAYGYCMMTYATAYLKAHYPLQFMCSLIVSEDSQDKIIPYISECKKIGIPILPPSVKVGNAEWVIENDSLRMGLTYIKGVGGNLKLVSDSFENFCKANNKGVVTALIKAGALDHFGARVELLRFVMVNAGKNDLLQKQEGDVARLKELESELLTVNPKLKKYEDMKKQISNTKKRITGREGKLSEIEKLERQIEKNDNTVGEVEVLGMAFTKLPQVQSGIVSHLYSKDDKKGREMAWVTIKNEYGEIRYTCFSSVWKNIKKIVTIGAKIRFYAEGDFLKEAQPE